MIYRLGVVAIALLLSALIAVAATVTGTMTVTIGTSGIIPPLQAQTAGYTINALNQDFSQSFDHDCGGGDTPGHLWYVATNGILLGNCNALTWPDTDQGNQVLTIKWTPGNIGLQNGRQGIVTESLNGTSTTTFPVRGYFECTIRMTGHVGATEIDLGTSPLLPGPWFNCFQWQSRTQPPSRPGCNTPICYERDNFEVHGVGQAGFNPLWVEFAGGLISWNANGILASLNRTSGDTGSFAYQAWCGRSPCTNGSGTTVGPVYDPSAYHKYGVLFTEPSSDLQCGTTPCIRADLYIDDALYYSQWGSAYSGGTTNPDAFLQRSYLIADVTTACWDVTEGDSTCNNIGITAANNVGGQLRLTLNRADGNGINLLSGLDGSVVYISGVGGNIADGNYYYNITNPNGNPAVITLATSSGGTPLSFTSGYTGSGTFNPLTSADMHMKSYRVWVGCSAWQTTQC